ncbi:MAG: SAM-dependent methyltransferase, partial [Proteobacteria bacterium]|nr:SAM-dependent methyltransferase [Pseudomonadota bacterium]
MDKLSIKKFAIWARNELLKRVGTRAQWFGITEKGIEELGNKNALGKLLTERELTQKNALVNKIRRDGYAQAMEEAAYIWFNRFCALRFMEVNGYLPSRVFSDEQGNFNPQILVDAIHLGDKIKGLDVNLVFEMKESNRRDELYKYLLITQCEALKETLPGMFDKLDDYSELLFPDFLLREESVIEQMVLMIPEDDWKDQVQIIGWLYQYYKSEPKDEVFANLKKNIKINKDNIPAATQLFTPDWIVRYMVENALGRLWQEGHPDETLKKEWKYYLNEAEQEP